MSFPDGGRLFRSTAFYYRTLRKPYPNEMFDLLRARFGLDGSGRLLDVGCGTGQLSTPPSSEFDAVIRLDVADEMIDEARLAATEAGVGNVRFEVRGAEQLGEADGPVRLALFGSSLHWMDIPSVLSQVHSITDEGVDSEWELALMDVGRQFLGEDRRAGDGRYSEPGIKFEDAISNPGYSSVESGEIPCDFEVGIPWITGHL
jgi:SAM-dependent methyltransferase